MVERQEEHAQVMEASKISWIDASSIALNSSSVCWADRPSVRPREKLATTPLAAGEARARLVAAVPAGERHDPQHARVRHEVGVEVVVLGERELQHHGLVRAQLVELPEDRGVEQLLGLGLLRALDVDLGLDDRDEPGAEDLAADLELLVHDLLDPDVVRPA